jgi:hypothetical protein
MFRCTGNADQTVVYSDTLQLNSIYQQTNALNKTQQNTNHKTQFVTSIKLLHVSAPESILMESTKTKEHDNLGTDCPHWYTGSGEGKVGLIFLLCSRRHENDTPVLQYVGV